MSRKAPSVRLDRDATAAVLVRGVRRRFGPVQALNRVDLEVRRGVAEAVVWLCSDRASYITGHPLAVEGGSLAT
jgi:NAD(P)-dependent dehydrogenase (short-subunit alcohol dehydrogenase family)